METLVLSDTYMVLGRVTWQRAMMDYMSGRVEILEEYEDKVIRTVSQVFPMPAVVRFLKKVTGFWKRKAKFNRANVWLRDRGHCQYCARSVPKNDFTFDHVFPKSLGGKTTWENIVVACVECNQKKNNHTLAQAGMTLIATPVMPKSMGGQISASFWGQDIPSCWKDYIGTIQHWTGELTP